MILIPYSRFLTVLSLTRYLEVLISEAAIALATTGTVSFIIYLIYKTIYEITNQFHIQNRFSYLFYN